MWCAATSEAHLGTLCPEEFGERDGVVRGVVQFVHALSTIVAAAHYERSHVGRRGGRSSRLRGQPVVRKEKLRVPLGYESELFSGSIPGKHPRQAGRTLPSGGGEIPIIRGPGGWTAEWVGTLSDGNGVIRQRNTGRRGARFPIETGLRLTHKHGLE